MTTIYECDKCKKQFKEEYDKNKTRNINWCNAGELCIKCRKKFFKYAEEFMKELQ